MIKNTYDTLKDVNIVNYIMRITNSKIFINLFGI